MTTTVDGIIGIVTTGNVTANNFFGNIDGNSINGDINTTGNATFAGNVSGFNVAAANQVYVGPLQLRAINPTTFGVFLADGVTQANIDVGNVDASQITQGTSVIAFDAVNGNAFVTIAGSNVLFVESTGLEVIGNINTTGNQIYSLGNSSNQWKDLWISDIYMENIPLTMVGVGLSSNLQVNGSNVLVEYANGNTTLSNIIVGGNATIAGRLVTTGNITGGNLDTTGQIVSSGNIIGGNLNTPGIVFAVGNVNGGNNSGWLFSAYSAGPQFFVFFN
jgi:hypothetical protein